MSHQIGCLTRILLGLCFNLWKFEHFLGCEAGVYRSPKLNLASDRYYMVNLFGLRSTTLVNAGFMLPQVGWKYISLIYYFCYFFKQECLIFMIVKIGWNFQLLNVFISFISKPYIISYNLSSSKKNKENTDVKSYTM